MKLLCECHRKPSKKVPASKGLARTDSNVLNLTPTPIARLEESPFSSPAFERQPKETETDRQLHIDGLSISSRTSKQKPNPEVQPPKIQPNIKSNSKNEGLVKEQECLDLKEILIVLEKLYSGQPISGVSGHILRKVYSLLKPLYRFNGQEWPELPEVENMENIIKSSFLLVKRRKDEQRKFIFHTVIKSMMKDFSSQKKLEGKKLTREQLEKAFHSYYFDEEQLLKLCKNQERGATKIAQGYRSLPMAQINVLLSNPKFKEVFEDKLAKFFEVYDLSKKIQSFVETRLINGGGKQKADRKMEKPKTIWTVAQCEDAIKHCKTFCGL